MGKGAATPRGLNRGTEAADWVTCTHAGLLWDEFHLLSFLVASSGSGVKEAQCSPDPEGGAWAEHPGPHLDLDSVTTQSPR
jgi:hypothetical protein